MNVLALTHNDIIRTISDEDEMYSGNEDRYFNVGRSALANICLALEHAQKPAADVKRILDLPCGHGRVLRHLRGAFPRAEITACDIVRSGVDFCTSTFGATPAYSQDDPDKIPLENDQFDLIWVGSLFTHLDSNLWLRFLKKFRSLLRPGGILVFTTHGRRVCLKMIAGMMIMKPMYYGLSYRRKLPVLYNYARKGFAYTTYVPDSDYYYGVSLSHPAWVISEVDKVGELRPVHYSEASVDNHHDCFSFVRDPDCKPHQPSTKHDGFKKYKLRPARRF
jgi:SAM-dependent methyltransferase